MKLYNPFKWHVVSNEGYLCLRKFSFNYGRWIYWSGTGCVTYITLAKEFRHSSHVKEYILDHYYFTPKKKEKPKFLISLDKL